MGASGTAALAFVIAHEYAHFVRGHSYTSTFQHKFGSFASVKKANTSEAKLLVRKQAESEADYYGVYYSLLAGYNVRASTLEEFWALVSPQDRGLPDSSRYIDDEHQSPSERVSNAEIVINEVGQLVKLHEAANVALLAGRYLDAAVVYEYICKDVVIPSVSWNELLARFLLLQQLTKREIVSPDVIRSEYVADFKYRSSDLRVNMDIEQAFYRCRALVEVLRAAQYNLDGIERINRLVDILQESIGCSMCNESHVCDIHGRRASGIEKAIVSQYSLTGSPKSQQSFTINPMEMLQVSKLIDEKNSVSQTLLIPLSYGLARITTFVNEGNTYIRFTYQSQQSRSMQRIDLVVEQCEDCEMLVVESRDNIVKQVRLGRKITAALFTE
jgi:hypothetical protein